MSSPISGFTAIPNPQMLAFMPIQSYLMMYFAGSGWQYGKRKISAMSNEQFNKLTPEELLQQHSLELKNMLPTLEKSLNDVTPLVRVLIEQYGDFIKAAIAATPQAIANIFPDTGALSNVPTTSGSGLPPAQMASFLHYFKSLADQTQGKPATKQSVFKAPVKLTFQQEHKQHGHPTGHIVPKFDSGQLKPQVSRSFEIRKAGQSAKMERIKLIKQISQLNQTRKNFLGTRNTRMIRIYTTKIKKVQQLLINIEARFTF